MSANFKKLLFLPKGLALLLACLPVALLAADGDYIAANASNIAQEASQAPKFTEASPAKPNQATVELIAIVEALLRKEEATFSYADSFGLEVTINGITHSVNLLLEKANFDSMVIDQTSMGNYLDILKERNFILPEIINEPIKYAKDDSGKYYALKKSFPSDEELKKRIISIL